VAVHPPVLQENESAPLLLLLPRWETTLPPPLM